MNSPWIYIVLAGFVLIICARFLPKASSGQESSFSKRDLEETIEQFAAELEAENKEILQAIAKMKQENDAKTAMFAKRLEILEKQLSGYAALQERMTTSDPVQTLDPIQTSDPTNKGKADNVSAQKSAASTLSSPLNIRERYGELFRLHDEGKSIDWIARKLEMNKGEVGLILQLASREEQRDV